MKSRAGRYASAGAMVLASLAASPDSRSAVAFYSTPFSITDIISGPVGSNFSTQLSAFQLLELPRFDPALGTLQSFDIQFQSTYEIFILGQARDVRSEVPFFPFGGSNDAGIDATVGGALQLRLFDPSSSTTTLNFPSVNAFCYQYLSEVGQASCLAQEGSSTAYNAIMALGAFGLADFAGTDPINLSTALNATVSGTCDGDDAGDLCELGVRTSWYGFIGVAYTYAAVVLPPGGGGGGNSVPVPGTILLAATGLGLLIPSRLRAGALGYRKKMRSRGRD